MDSDRDLLGYGRSQPHPHWPGEARVAVSFVVNLEEGAEFAIGEGDGRNEAVYEVIDRIDRHPDPCLQSHFDYGIRAGWRRVMDIFAEFGVPVTVSACGRAAERLPSLVREAVALGHEVSAHGWRWESHVAMSVEHEREAIARTVQAITEATGVRPVGWHTRSASSSDTRRLLREEGGFLYDSDFYGDDLPVTIARGARPYVMLPYAFDTNDMQFQHSNRFVRAADFSGYVTDAFDWLWQEGARHPKMMSIGLHLRMLGRPGRIGALRSMLAHMTGRGGAWVARRDQIARHWLTVEC
ncbi:Uricase (urate oxidase) (plasmid) [Cupriavidus necator H850]|uniref:polysaccharide deacetylase family protein n=1 Tax=Cupriavidus necator TaxID=106590 RepID=UPI00129E1A1D|nr:polysaccharide deacetylase family protein [Cupriavidus necator]KAI3603835.1 Uricase (urate oxidase) [Cupriavidus necator H850]